MSVIFLLQNLKYGSAKFARSPSILINNTFITSIFRTTGHTKHLFFYYQYQKDKLLSNYQVNKVNINKILCIQLW